MSERLFGTDGIRGSVNADIMNPQMVLKVGLAFARFLKKNKNSKRPKVVIGKDTRLSGYIFETALTSGLCSMGIDVYLLGPMPTPAVAHITRSFAADAGIMITASHNPAGDNGLKFFGPDGYKYPQEFEEEIERIVVENNVAPDPANSLDMGKAFRIEDARGRYIEFAKSTIGNMSMKGLKIVLDCSNGAAYNVAPLIFRELGAEVIIIGADPDGLNINKGCGSQSLDLIRKTVEENRANCGIALDGDGDRVIMIDEKSDIVDGDQILFLSAKYLKEMDGLNKDTVVATKVSNLGLEKSLENIGLKLVRTDVGDKHVVDEMKGNGYNLGGEQCGHMVFGDYSTTGDGTITALKVLSIIKGSEKTLSELKGEMKLFPQVQININVKEKKPIDDMECVKQLIADYKAYIGHDSRVLVRYSGTENKCRIMVEGNEKSKLEEYSNMIAKNIKNEVGK